MIQAMTQVQDQTVSFVPKLLIVMAGIGISLPWLSDRMVEFSHDVLSKPMMWLMEPVSRRSTIPSTTRSTSFPLLGPVSSRATRSLPCQPINQTKRMIGSATLGQKPK